MTPTRTSLPKNDPHLLRQVRRYVRRFGGKAEAAYDIIKLAQLSGPKDPERRLAEAVAEAGLPPAVAKQALAGFWSDFKSPLEFPKTDLVEMLAERGHTELCERVKAGEFDG